MKRRLSISNTDCFDVRFLNRLAALIVLLLTAGGPLSAKDFFLDAESGNDTAEASRDRPWRTIARANTNDFAPGDRLLFQGGQMFHGNLALDAHDAGTAERPVTIGSYGEGRARIDGGAGTGVFVRDAGGIVVRDLVVIGAGPEQNVGSGVRFENTRDDGSKLEAIRVLDVECSGFGGRISEKMSGFKIPFYDFGEGIFVGCRAENQTRSGFRDVLIERCVAFNNAFCGIGVAGRETADFRADAGEETRHTNQHVRILHCSAHDNPGDPRFMQNHLGSGIFVQDVDGALVDHCLAWNNGARCAATSGGPCGIWAALGRRVVIQWCESWDNRTASLDGDGFDFDGGVCDSTLQYCYSHGNDGAGFLIYSYAGSPGFHGRNIIRFNVSIDDARLKSYGGITLGNDGGRFNGVEILHNTVVNSGDGRSALRLVGGGTARGVHFSGNLFLARKGALLIAGGAQPELTFRGNAWWSAGAPARFRWAGTDHAALADWRAAAKLETGERADIETDPRIVLPGQAPAYAEDFARTKRSDFRPTASSPLRHAIRMNANAGPHDFSGTPLSSAGEPGTIGALQNAAE